MKRIIGIVGIALLVGACVGIAHAGPLTSGSAIIGEGGWCRDSNGTISPCVSGDSFGGAQINYSSIDNWDSAVSAPHAVTGIDSHEVGADSCKVSINGGDSTLIDIEQCHVHIQGPEYELAAVSGMTPPFGIGENSLFVGVTLSGYTTQIGRWTAAQQQTIVPIARLNTPAGQTGPGSDVGLIRDDRYFSSERDYKDRLWSQEAIGALYANGGQLFSYSTIVMGQYSGILYNAQRERHVLAEFSNMSAVFVHLSSNSIPIANKAPFVVDNLTYQGTGLEAMTPNRWTNISILKSPQGANGVQEGGWFYIYGGEYLTQAAAEAADFDFGVFGSQGASGLVPLASIVVKQAGVTIDTDLFIIDKRSCLVCRP